MADPKKPSASNPPPDEELDEKLDEEEEEAIRARGRKKGWSATKIDRSIESRSHTGGLDLEITRRVGNAARDGALSLLVFWDENETTPTGGRIVIPAASIAATVIRLLLTERDRIRANGSS